MKRALKSNPMRARWLAIGALSLALLTIACGRDVARSEPTAATSATSTAGFAAEQSPQISAADKAPPASQTGGFDGARAYDHTAKMVSFGPRPPASDAIHRTQDYIRTQLKSFGCAIDEDDFHSQTPIGSLEMKNIFAKIPGDGPGIILLLTHYDTARIDNFVGAEDAGSSTGLMLEMARLLCAQKKQPNAVWIAFLDGEEAQVKWSDTDSVYGSRELAASLAVSGDLKRVRAVVLADMIGQHDLKISRDSDSTPWLVDLVWRTAARLGYGNIFVSDRVGIDDDHDAFLKRGVAAVDIIDLLDYQQIGYWHTPQDTLDKVSPRSIAIVGHVILESLGELQQRFR
jgi:glutaminyl-peptide cyclotransferase